VIRKTTSNEISWAALGIVLAVLVVLLCLAAFVLADPPGVASDSGLTTQNPGQLLPSIKDTGGKVTVSGTLQTSKSVLPGTGLELVWVSTPTVTSGSGHAKVWLNQQGSTKSAVKVIFDDGTIVSLANN
jgi:hypothetical protein